MSKMMKAAQLSAYNQPLQINEIPIPEPKGEEVVIKIGGAGLCHSDLHLMGGEIPVLPYFPFTLGHENAGWVEQVGDGVQGFKIGDPVAVFGGWSTKPDRFTWSGHEQLTDLTKWVGIGQPGGYAQYLLVPTYRYLLPLQGLDPIDAAPLTDAGLTPYRAVKRLLPHLYPNSTVVIIGVGGLGQFGVEYARALTPSCNIIAIDINDNRLDIAKNLGADTLINSANEDAVAKVKEITDGEGAQGIIDFVGSDSTMAQAFDIAGRQAKCIIVGLAGGTLNFKTGLINEAEFSSSSWGSQVELSEVLALARKGVAKSRIQRVKFDEINDAFDELRAGKINGRAVLVPNN